MIKGVRVTTAHEALFRVGNHIVGARGRKATHVLDHKEEPDARLLAVRLIGGALVVPKQRLKATAAAELVRIRRNARTNGTKIVAKHERVTILEKRPFIRIGATRLLSSAVITMHDKR